MKTLGDIYYGNRLDAVDVGKTGTYVLKKQQPTNPYLTTNAKQFTQTISFLNLEEVETAKKILDRNLISYRSDNLTLKFEEGFDLNIVKRLLNQFNIS